MDEGDYGGQRRVEIMGRRGDQEKCGDGRQMAGIWLYEWGDQHR